MRDAICLTRQLKELGWRVEVTADGPTLKRTVDGAILPAGVKRQLAAVRSDLIRLNTVHVCEVPVGTLVPLTGPHEGTGHTIEQRPCGATVFDGVLLAEANNTGVGCGCPYAHCPYRG